VPRIAELESPSRPDFLDTWHYTIFGFGITLNFEQLFIENTEKILKERSKERRSSVQTALRWLLGVFDLHKI
jgi:hypothetical protein